MTIEEAISETLKRLPPAKQREVLDFAALLTEADSPRLPLQLSNAARVAIQSAIRSGVPVFVPSVALVGDHLFGREGLRSSRCV